MELGKKEVLGFLCGGIKCKPASVARVSDAGAIDTSFYQPRSYRVNCNLVWSKCLDDLVRRPVLAVILRVWMGALDASV